MLEMKIEFETQNAGAIAEALRADSSGKRSQVKIAAKQNILTLTMKSQDKTAMRSALNSYVRLVHAAQSSLEVCT